MRPIVNHHQPNLPGEEHHLPSPFDPSMIIIYRCEISDHKGRTLRMTTAMKLMMMTQAAVRGAILSCVDRGVQLRVDGCATTGQDD